MALKVPYVGDVNLLDRLRTSWGTSLLLGLFKNNITPTDATVWTDLVEADFDGYSQAGLAGWVAATIVGTRAKTACTPVTFTKTAGATGNNIYGYFVLDGGSNLLWLERDPAAPIDMNGVGNTYLIVPSFTLKSEY